MAVEWDGPVLGKRETPHGSADEPREYVPVTWNFFLGLRAWARWMARQTNSHAYLVGSALDHDAPRDVDVAFVWPSDEYERHFGPIPRNDDEVSARWQSDFKYARHAFIVSAWQGVGYKPYIDVHLCPDGWYRQKPRLLLGSPDCAPGPTGWCDEEFVLMTVTHQDGRIAFEWRDGICWDEEGA